MTPTTPTTTLSHHDVLTSRFAEALALPSGEREAFLERDVDNADLRAELRSLLHYHESTHDGHLNGDMWRDWLLADPVELQPGEVPGLDEIE